MFLFLRSVACCRHLELNNWKSLSAVLLKIVQQFMRYFTNINAHTLLVIAIVKQILCFPQFSALFNTTDITQICCTSNSRTSSFFTASQKKKWFRQHVSAFTVFLYSCLPLTASCSNPTVPKPSLLIAMPATDLAKFQPPPLVSSPDSLSIFFPFSFYNLEGKMTSIFLGLEPVLVRLCSLLHMLLVDSFSNTLSRKGPLLHH